MSDKKEMTIITKNGSEIRFKAVTDKPLTSEEAIRIQANSGFVASGYGFYWFSCTKTPEGYVSVWSCNSSSD